MRGNLLDELRQNGTEIQTNSTHLWRYQGGGDAVTGRSRFFVRFFGSDQSYHQSFSSISAGRASESLNRLQTVPSQEFGAAAQWAATWNEITAVAGMDVRDVRATNVETQYANGTPGTVTDITARQRASGGYAELLWQHAPWSAALSGRVDDFRTFDAKKHVGGTLTNLARTDEVVFNPRLGVVRKLGYGVSLSGSVFRAFRGPTLNELYRNSQVGQQLTLPNDSLRSERATGFEFGAQKDMRAGTVRGSYFWTEVNRPVSALLLNSTPTSQTLRRENLGQIRSRGVSVDFVTQPASFLQLSGGYQLAIATVTRFQPDPSLVGNWIPEVARHAATLQLRAEHRRIGVLNLQGRESGRLYDNSANSAVLHGFFRMDVEAERTFARRWDLAVTVQNLLDRRIEAGRTPTLTLATPRVVTVSLRLHRSR
ncbi:MAG: TonB-dependent receptor [Acidobacteria bacterium]|nr:TonB-dependent receptor [Acidobacteriota bacterium]